VVGVEPQPGGQIGKPFHMINKHTTDYISTFHHVVYTACPCAASSCIVNCLPSEDGMFQLLGWSYRDYRPGSNWRESSSWSEENIASSLVSTAFQVASTL